MSRNTLADAFARWAEQLRPARPNPPNPPRKIEMNVLSGYKTYIVAAIMLLTGIAGMIGIDIPSFDGHAPASLVMEALAFMFLRKGLKSDVGNG
jgi:hypothetical protein